MPFIKVFSNLIGATCKGKNIIPIPMGSIFKSPKQSGESYRFCSVSSSYHFFSSSSNSFSFRPHFSVTTRWKVLKFRDMVDMGMKLCNGVSKFKMSDSKTDPWACPKSAKFCLDYFSLTTQGIVLIFYMIDIDI